MGVPVALPSIIRSAVLPGNLFPSPEGLIPHVAAERFGRHPPADARSRWNWLLVVPVVVPLLTFLYNANDPGSSGSRASTGSSWLHPAGRGPPHARLPTDPGRR